MDTTENRLDFLDNQLSLIRAMFERNGIALPPDDKLSAKELAAEIEIRLRQSAAGLEVANMPLMMNDGSLTQFDSFLRFAANNIATAYAGRVVR